MENFELNKREQQISVDLSNALTKTHLNKENLSGQKVMEKFDGQEKHFCALLNENLILQSEVKRRVAELKLYSAIDMDFDANSIDKYFENISNLGYTNLEKRASVQIIYARHCYKIGKVEKADALLLNLRIAINTENSANENMLYTHLISVIDELYNDQNQ